MDRDEFIWFDIDEKDKDVIPKGQDLLTEVI